MNFGGASEATVSGLSYNPETVDGCRGLASCCRTGARSPGAIAIGRTMGREPPEGAAPFALTPTPSGR